jgi:kynurenine formamidase
MAVCNDITMEFERNHLMTKLFILPVLVCFSFTSLAKPSVADEPPTVVSHDVTTADVERMMKDLSNWGRWGDDDQLGTINLITPKKRREASALVKDGVSVSMAHDVVKVDMDGSAPFRHKVTINPKDGDTGSAGDEYAVAYHGFTQTHLDGLCHLFYKDTMYNGYSTDLVTERGAEMLSVNQMRNGIFTRAVLMDMPELFGKRYLDKGKPIYPEHLEAWEKQTGIKVGPGDALIIRTGAWLRREVEGPWEIMKGSAGLHASCLPWLKKRDVALVGSDLALDVMPSQVAGFELPVHWVVVTAMGTPILDNLDLRAVSQEAAARKRWEFLLTVAPLAVEGGTGSPVNPVATF